jgi:hypothetical protein
MEVLLPVIGELLIEVCILLLLDVFRFSHPERLVFIDLLKLSRDLLDLLLLLLFLLLLDFTLIFFLLLFFFIIRDLFFSCLLNLKFDCEPNELRMLLDEILESFLFKEF